MKVIAFVLSAKELSRIGAKGWTVVSPIKAKTTTYKAPVNDTAVSVSSSSHVCGDLKLTEWHTPSKPVEKGSYRWCEDDRDHTLE